MHEKGTHKTPYTPPVIESLTFRVESGFADSVTDGWQNSFSVDPSAGDGKVNLLLWTDQTKTTPTNANEQFDEGWSNDDFWNN